jgi:CheY-like chemotaxis protein
VNDVIVSPPTPSEDDAPAATGSHADAALAAVRDVSSEIMRLVRSTATQATDGWSLATVMRSLVPDLERAFAERGALEREVQALRARIADTAEMESMLASREAGWSAERTGLEADAAREREQAETLAAECTQRRAEIEVLQGRERRVREQMETVAARAHTDREETLRLAREMVQSAEEARFAVVEEMETLRAALAAEQSRLVEIQHERARATQGAVAAEVELERARQIIEQLETSRANAAAELARARTSLVRTESELLAAQHEYQLAQVQIDKLCAAHDDMIEDHAQLVAKLHDAGTRDAKLRLRINGLEQRLQTAGTTPTTPAELVEDDREEQASALALQLSRAEQRARALEDEVSKAKAAASAATARVNELQADNRRAEQARTAALADVERLRSTVEQLERRPAAAPEPDPIQPEAVAAMPEPDPEPEPSIETIGAESVEELVVLGEPAPPAPEPLEAAEPVAIDVEEPEVDDEAILDDPAAEDDGPVGLETFAPAQEPDTTPDATPEPSVVSDEAPAVAPGTIAVLDANAAWHGPDAIVAHTVEPDAAAAERIRELAPSACLANLATPGVLPVLVALRAANDATPIVACAVAPGADAGLALGSFDVLTRPVDPEHVRRQVERLAPAKATVVMVGSESAILIPLRQGLLALGATVRTAWNRQQAIELADSVRPDVVIVDLASEAAGGAALVAELAQRDGAPRIVLVAAGTTQHDALATELAAHAAAGTVECAELVRTAARP